MNRLVWHDVPKELAFEKLADEHVHLMQEGYLTKKTGKFSFFSQTEFFISIFAPDKLGYYVAF